ncbi:glycosyltransferase family 2 protein [Compostibacter hankyongensis]|uniref:Glycosyltransferase 2-like domain-containing protein n=1 Tax=Compostibacter hankyongensis TaxID=1007089 RepID=A0ABP8FWQ4_9BACT
MKLSVIITTYNAPAWLEKVLWGYRYQRFRDFELLVADDGSTADTAALIEKMRPELGVPLQHVWQEDEGFRKCTILNKAIMASTTDYLVFSDGDCIPRADFLEVHNREKQEGRFLSGGYFKLPMPISQAITLQDIAAQTCFDIRWLRKQGLEASFKDNKLTASGLKAAWLNRLTPTNASWNGHNASGWKRDILAVNGYDERMRYGALDRELGERLMNKGIRGRQIRYSAVCLHLDHSRGYVNDKDLQNNAAIREATRRGKRTWTESGIVKGPGPEKEARPR